MNITNRKLYFIDLDPFSHFMYFFMCIKLISSIMDTESKYPKAIKIPMVAEVENFICEFTYKQYLQYLQL